MYHLGKKQGKNVYLLVFFCKVRQKDKSETNEFGFQWVVVFGNRWESLWMGTGDKGCGGSGTSQNINFPL